MNKIKYIILSMMFLISAQTTLASMTKSTTSNTKIVHSSTKLTSSSTTVAAKSKKSKKNTSYMVGIASHYGSNDGFEGQQMANGEYFDPTDLSTAAHPTLPLGTKLKVTNLNNNKVVYVEVKDRMPKQHRVIDLSSAAAKFLNMYRRGLARVKLEIVSNSQYTKQQELLAAKNQKSSKSTDELDKLSTKNI